MARLIPNYYISGYNLYGEHRVFHSLKNSKELEDYYVFHSLNIPNHLVKKEGEADYVILGPLGLLVIEIKGANKIVRSDGAWQYYNNKLSYMSKESPFNQAKYNLYTLLKNIQDNVTDIKINIKNMSGYGVIFPNLVFREKSIEWDPAMVLDENRIDKIDEYIIKLFKYWRNKASFIKGMDLVPSQEIEKIASYLRGNFETVESVRSFLKKNAENIARLTEEQNAILESLADNNRILINGCAGTGKTFLAIEQAKRSAYQGKKTLFLCYNKILVKNIHTQLKHHKNIDIINLDSLYYKILKESGETGIDSTNLRDTIYKKIKYNNLKLPSYDSIIIDEGQDILSSENIDVIGNMLKDGLREGNWIIFYDLDAQAKLFGPPDLQKNIEHLQKIAVCFTLNTNCRNPKNVIQETGQITGLPIAKYNKLEAGSNNIVKIPYAEEEELSVKISDLLNEIVRSGVKPHQVTILFPGGQSYSA